MGAKNYILAVLAAICISVSASAQKPFFKAYNDTKMSPWLYDQYQQQQQQQTAPRNNGAPLRSQEKPVRKYVLALVESTDGDATIRRKGGVVVQDFWDGISAAFLPVDSLGVLDRCEHILCMEANDPGRIMNDTSAIITGVDKVWAGQGALPQAFTGKGVYAGIMDIGFDFTHPAFRNDDGTSRIRWFWDPAAPNGAPDELGMIYTSPEMVLAARHTTDAELEDHGTHCLGTMAGNGLNGRYVGMAPEADIIGSYIPLGGKHIPDYKGLGKSLVDYLKKHQSDYEDFTDETIELLDSDIWHVILLYRIFKQADSEGKPCVMNWSFGRLTGFLYDTRRQRLYNTLIDNMLGPGHIIVAATCNEGGKKRYIRIEADGLAQQVIRFMTNGDLEFPIQCRSIVDTTRFNMSFTFINTTFDMTDTVTFDMNELSTDSLDKALSRMILIPCPADSDLSSEQKPVPDTIFVKAKTKDNIGDTVIFEFTITFPQSYCDSFKQYSNMLGMVLIDTPQKEVELFALKSAQFNYGDASTSRGCYLGTIASPADMERVIAVGAMQHRSTFTNIDGDTIDSAWLGSQEGHLASFSSCGPTMDGRIKPDVVAPGVNILSVLNSYYPYDGNEIAYETEAFGRKYRIAAENGTSMAAPIVAGIIALWLQAKPDLTPEEILGVLERTSHQPEPEFSGYEKNNYYGWGEIDAYAGLLDILGLTNSVPGLSQHQPVGITFRLEGQTFYIDGIDTDTPITVYDLNGRPVVNTVTSDGKIELPALPQGVYAVQVGTLGSTLIRL